MALMISRLLKDGCFASNFNKALQTGNGNDKTLDLLKGTAEFNHKMKCLIDKEKLVTGQIYNTALDCATVLSQLNLGWRKESTRLKA